MNKEKEEKLSVLWYSNSPAAVSGYGKCAKYICTGLAKDRRVGISPNYGWGMGEMTINDFTIHAQGGGLSLKETIHHYLHHDYDTLITQYDTFVLGELANLVKKHNITWTPYVPIDFEIIPHNIKNILSTATMIIPFSYFAYNKLSSVGFTNLSDPIYHGVDTEVYTPNNSPKEELRQALGFRDKQFIITIVAMNKGMRKCIQDQLEGIKIFLDNNPDMVTSTGIYLHTDPGRGDGVNLRELVKELGITDYVRFPEGYSYFQGWTEEQMSLLYNASDVVLNCTSSEGFGMAIPEAMSCGIPVIATDVMVMKELLAPVTPELLVKSRSTQWIPINSLQHLPDVYDIAEKIEDVLNTDPEVYRKKLPEYARKTFDWEKIIQKWNIFLDEVLPQYMDKKCLKIPETRSTHLKSLSKEIIEVI